MRSNSYKLFHRASLSVLIHIQCPSVKTSQKSWRLHMDDMIQSDQSVVIINPSVVP